MFYAWSSRVYERPRIYLLHQGYSISKTKTPSYVALCTDCSVNWQSHSWTFSRHHVSKNGRKRRWSTTEPSRTSCDLQGKNYPPIFVTKDKTQIWQFYCLSLDVSTRRSIITVRINATNGKLNIVLLPFWGLFLKIFSSNLKAQYSLKSDIEYTKT